MSFVLFLSVNAAGQTESESHNYNADDSLFENDTFFTQHGERHFVTALTGMFVPTVVISLWNRYASGSGWAKVDYKSNFDDIINGTVEWEWDTDWYWTNFVLHPYQGQLAYSSLRDCNFTQAESLLAATFSSLVWETMCENNTPSLNDMVYTSVGAWPMGEMLHRLAFEADEAAGPVRFLITPMRTWTEFLTGEKPYGTHGNIKEFSVYTGFGCAYGKNIPEYSYSADSELYPLYGNFGFNVVYGDAYARTSNDPFSCFTLSMGGSMGKGCGAGYKDLEKDVMHDLYIFSDGFVFSRDASKSENYDTTVGLIFDYDFLWHSFMNFSSLAPGFGIKQRILSENCTVEWEAHADAVLLATSDFWYTRRRMISEEKVFKAYNYSVGAELVQAVKIKPVKGIRFSASNHVYALYEFSDDQYEIKPGFSFFDYAKVTAELPLSDSVYFGIENTLYAKCGFYKEYPSIFSFMCSGGAFIRYVIK